MGIVAKGKTGTRHVASSGLHRAVLADVHDQGWNETQWGPKHHVLLVFEIDEEHPEFGGPFRVNKRYNLSLHEKATLSQDLESWRGKSFTKKQRKEGIDLKVMIGECALINVVHNEKDDATYANIKAILPLPKDQEPLEVSKDYVRIKDRKDEDAKKNGSDNFGADSDDWPDNLEGDFDPDEDDDELPF